MIHFNRVLSATAVLCSGLFLIACSTPGYRCSLDTSETPESPTACASMQDALAGAKSGTGGHTSVLIDDKGRLVPPELLENRPLTPLAQKLNSVVGDFKSAPTFERSKVFQVWTPASVDAQGVAHDARQSWFATPGAWRIIGAKGSGYQPSVSAQPIGAVTGVESSGGMTPNLLRPSKPADNFLPKYVSADAPVAAVPATRVVAPASASTRPAETKEQNKSTINALSSAVNAATRAKPAGAGVTGPAVSLAD